MGRVSGLIASLAALGTGCGVVFDIDHLDDPGPDAPAVDTDGDTVADVDDNCPDKANTDQVDTNGDGIGDACSNFCTGTCPDPVTCACIDFDDSPTLPPDWTLAPEGTATGALTTGDVRSGPRALGLHVPPSPSIELGERNLVTFGRGLLSNNLHIVYDLDWKLSYFDPMASGHTVQLISVFMANISNVGLGHHYNGTDPGFWYLGVPVDGVGTLQVIPAPPTDYTRWTHVHMDVTFSSTGTGHAYLAFDGVEVVHLDHITNAPATTGPQTLSANVLGWVWQGTNPDLQQTVDNLTFTVD